MYRMTEAPARPATAAEVLDRAAEVLELEGYCRGAYVATDRCDVGYAEPGTACGTMRCLIGALECAAVGGVGEFSFADHGQRLDEGRFPPALVGAYRALNRAAPLRYRVERSRGSDMFGPAEAWSEEAGPSASEVVALIRRAADRVR
jgi:hypothetical protein